MTTVEERLRELGLDLPAAAAPAANYVPFVLEGSLLHIAGQIPFRADGSLVRGLLGGDMNIEAGQEAARRCALGLVAQMKAATGDLGRVRRIVKLGAFVASAPGFFDQPKVANGASDLLVDLFGERGRHARSAVGVSALPLGVAVEIDAVVAVD